MNILAQLRPKFLGRPRREKLLLVAFLIALTVIWLGSIVGRAQTTVGQTAAISQLAKDQRKWLDDRTEIESNFDAAMAALRNAPLPPRRQVTAGIEELLRKHGLTPYTLPTPEHLESDGLAINTFTITVPRAQWPNLYAFHEDISIALPSINIAEIRLQSSAARGNEPNPSPPLSARVQLVAVELNR